MKTDFKIAVGLRIKHARAAKGLSQAQLAEEAGRSIEAVSNLERGISLPPLERMEKICEILGISLATAFEKAPNNRAERHRQNQLLEIQLICRSLDDQRLTIAVNQLRALKP